MTNYWFCITNLENYRITDFNHIWGVEKRFELKIKKFKPGDKIIFYIKGRQLGDIFEVKSKSYSDESELFNGGKFPYRVKLESIKKSEQIHILTDEMIKKLDLFKYKGDKWKNELHGQAIKPLSKKDFDYISSKLLKEETEKQDKS
jgi:predicted RNA-binding protein